MRVRLVCAIFACAIFACAIFVCAIFNLCLALAFLAAGVWEGVIPLAASALIFWTRRVRQRSVPS